MTRRAGAGKERGREREKYRRDDKREVEYERHSCEIIESNSHMRPMLEYLAEFSFTGLDMEIATEDKVCNYI